MSGPQRVRGKPSRILLRAQLQTEEDRLRLEGGGGGRGGEGVGKFFPETGVLLFLLFL